MGSFSRFSAMERFIKTFGNRFEEGYKTLIGQEVQEFFNYDITDVVQGDIRLSDGSVYPVHHRWASPEESDEEILEDPEEMTMKDYFNKHIIGKKIERVELNHVDRDDEVYLLAFLDQGDKVIEIPVGFDPEHRIIKGLAEDFLTDKEQEDFLEKETV